MGELTKVQKDILRKIQLGKKPIYTRPQFTRKATQGNKNSAPTLYNNKTINALIRKGLLKLDRSKSNDFVKVYVLTSKGSKMPLYRKWDKTTRNIRVYKKKKRK